MKKIFVLFFLSNWMNNGARKFLFRFRDHTVIRRGSSGWVVCQKKGPKVQIFKKTLVAEMNANAGSMRSEEEKWMQTLDPCALKNKNECQRWIHALWRRKMNANDGSMRPEEEKWMPTLDPCALKKKNECHRWIHALWYCSSRRELEDANYVSNATVERHFANAHCVIYWGHSSQA